MKRAHCTLPACIGISAACDHSKGSARDKFSFDSHLHSSLVPRQSKAPKAAGSSEHEVNLTAAIVSARLRNWFDGGCHYRVGAWESP